MNVLNAIETIEGQFDCSMGAPWRWADVLMKQVYEHSIISEKHFPDDVSAEHRLSSAMIRQFDAMRWKASNRRDIKPKLYWRWADKIRYSIEDGMHQIECRFYIEGNPQYMGKPDPSGGRPTAGHLRLAA